MEAMSCILSAVRQHILVGSYSASNAPSLTVVDVVVVVGREQDEEFCR